MLGAYSHAMEEAAGLFDSSFSQAIELIANLSSILIVTGIGKSGLIGQKATATFNSTGTRSVFVHPVEALHGDLGIVRDGTAMLALSKSGSNAETLEFVSQFKNVTNGPVVSISEADTLLARQADIALSIPTLPEIDAWNLAPTVSSSTTLAICDVLAICVQQQKGFTIEDFAQFHPSGTLGRRLLLQVRELMLTGTNLPKTSTAATLRDAIDEISAKRLGFTLLENQDGSYFGMITDGDIRRLTERKELNVAMSAQLAYELSRRGDDLPEVRGGITSPKAKAFDSLAQMREERITTLVVIEANQAVGVVRMQDLVAAGL